MAHRRFSGDEAFVKAHKDDVDAGNLGVVIQGKKAKRSVSDGGSRL
jgi:hypothetical protein